MDTLRWQQISELFDEVVACSNHDRTFMLDLRCADDAELRAEIESLLAAHDKASSVVEWPDLRNLAFPEDPRALGADTEILGPYRLIRQIGVGGTGAVYEAEQDSPRRLVALKVLRSLPNRDELTARLFQRECIALARLQHPGIASIYEAGQSKEGWQFIAMERVVGHPLSEFAQEKGLSIEARLQLFAAICDIVQYAHQRGVIHRDLKPANILITPDGQPKILDFGLARIIDNDAAVADATRPGIFQGTPAYASPEQTQGRSDEIDARSDLYSLGVILYELLTEKLPYRLDGLTLADAAGIIRERSATPAGAHSRVLRGDPETILAKCLEKDPARRYASASSLADDIRRFLNHEPIEARRSSAAYVLKKTLWRYRHATVGAIAFVLFLIAGLITVYVQWRHADTARIRAEGAEAEQNRLRLIAVNARDDATEMANQADRARRRAERHEDQTSEIVECLGAVLRNHGDFAAAVPRFEKALVRAREDGEPLHEANICQHLGMVFRVIGRNEDAKLQFQNTLQLRKEANAPPQRIVRTLVELGEQLLESGAYVDAEECFREAMKLTNKEIARPRILALLRLGLGRALTGTGRYVEAENLLQSAWESVSQSAHPSEMPGRQIAKALAELYGAWSKSSFSPEHTTKAQQWQSKVEDLK